MRILFCTDTYPPQVNGVSVVTALSVEGLRRRGWACHIIAPRYPDGATDVFETADHDPATRTSIPSIPLPVYPDIRIAAPLLRTVREAVSRFAPDIIHCATEFVVGQLGMAAARRTRVPVCTSYHTDFARYTAAYGMAWMRRPVTRWVRGFHRQAHRVFTPSAPAREALLGLGLSDVEVWGRGVDARLFHPERRSHEWRLRHGLGAAFVFLHVGRLAPEKDIEVLLDAFALLASTAPAGSVRLVIAGAGPSERLLRRRAHPAVTFLGNLDRQRELPTAYASADAFAFASSTETLGLVVLEAMAAGLPVIASPEAGVVDHLRDDANGLAFPARDAAACADAMRRLVQDEPLRRRLGAGARATAVSRSWDDEIARLDASYREVLRRPRVR